MAKASPYTTSMYRARKKGRHVVLFGALSPGTVSAFLVEFFHEDHGFCTTDVVILVGAIRHHAALPQGGCATPLDSQAPLLVRPSPLFKGSERLPRRMTQLLEKPGTS
jgi:hypothetical protein